MLAIDRCPFVEVEAPEDLLEFQLEPGSCCRIATVFYVPMVPSGSPEDNLDKIRNN